MLSLLVTKSPKKVFFCVWLRALTPYCWIFPGSCLQIRYLWSTHLLPQLWQVWCVLDSVVQNLKHALTKAGLVADMSNKCSGGFTTTPNVLPEANCHGKKKWNMSSLKSCSINQIAVNGEANQEAINWVVLVTYHSVSSQQAGCQKSSSHLFSVTALMC